MQQPKVVLITGASSGIGKESVRLFASKNWQVIATMRKPEEEKDLNTIPNVFLAKLDITDKTNINELFEIVDSQFGKVDVLINNAGYGLISPFEAADELSIYRQFQTNLFGIINLTKKFLPLIKKSKIGRIINISSIAGRIGLPFYSFYNSSKWAVEGLTESLYHELMPLNIKVKLIEPGPILTEFFTRSLQIITSENLPEYSSRFSKTLYNLKHTKRFGTKAMHVAKKIYTAATDRSNKLRYTSDLTGLLILIARNLLPDWLFLFLMRKSA